MWACCLRMCCPESNNNDDEEPLLVCKKISKCSHGIHYVKCNTCRTRSRYQGRDWTCSVQPEKCSRCKLVSSKPSTDCNSSHCKKPKNTDSKLETEMKNELVTTEDRSNWRNKEDHRHNNYTPFIGENEAKNQGKSSGAIKKICTKKNKNRTEHNVGQLGRLEEGMEICDAGRHTSRADDSKSLKSTLHGKETEFYERHYRLKKCEPSVRKVEALKKRPGMPRVQTVGRSPSTNTSNHLSEEGYGEGCSGDSDYAQHSYGQGRGRKTSTRMKREPVSKSDGQVGAWIDDQVDTIPITVSLPDIGTKHCQEVQLSMMPSWEAVGCLRWDRGDINTSHLEPTSANLETPQQNCSKQESISCRYNGEVFQIDLATHTPKNLKTIGCFRQDMGDANTSTDLESPDQGCSKQGSVLPRHNGEVFQIIQAPNTSKNFKLESPRNLSVESFDDLSYGTVHFKASYYPKTKGFFVHIENVEEMPQKAETFFYRVMLKLTILPNEKQTKNSASVKSPDMNPSFLEDFNFFVSDPCNKVLKISAYDADLQGKYNALGHAMFHLKCLTKDEAVLHSYQLLREPWVDSWPGRLEVTLEFEQATKVLSLTVHRAERLTVVLRGTRDSSDAAPPERYNTFAKVKHYCGAMKLQEERTCTVLNSRDPKYCSTFKFKLSLEKFHENFIVVAVKLKSLVKDSELGRVIFGPLLFASGSIHTPWGLAIAKNHTVTSWFKLYL